MTSSEFRQDENRVNELRTALANPVLQEALLVLHDSKSIVDAPANSDALVSVRFLSRIAGRGEVITELYELATPLSPPQPTPEPTFGVTDPPPDGWNETKI